MHHGGPTCEDACWMLDDVVGRTCTLCAAGRGLLVDYSKPPMSFEAAQHLGLFRPRRWSSFMAYCRFLDEHEAVPPNPSGYYVAAQLVIGATEEEKWAALDELHQQAEGERKNQEFRNRAETN